MDTRDLPLGFGMALAQNEPAMKNRLLLRKLIP